MLAQLPEDLLHLEGGQDRLDEHGGANGAMRDAEPILGVDEDIVPEPRLEVRLELGQVEVGAGAAIQLFAGVVKKDQPEVEQRCADGLTIDQQVGLVEVPAARPDDQGGDGVVEGVRLLIGLES